MDAVSFVMGEKTNSLRVKRLGDLIHGASIGQPISRSAHVTAVFQLENGAEKKFTRAVHGSSSDHRINDEVCFWQFLYFVDFISYFSVFSIDLVSHFLIYHKFPKQSLN